MKKTILTAATALLVSMTASADRTGQEVYNTKCAMCHAAGVANAPKFGDAAAWSSRAAMGLDALTASAMKGKNAMPPKGMCMDCNEAEIKASIAYMLDNSK